MLKPTQQHQASWAVGFYISLLIFKFYFQGQLNQVKLPNFHWDYAKYLLFMVSQLNQINWPNFHRDCTVILRKIFAIHGQSKQINWPNFYWDINLITIEKYFVWFNWSWKEDRMVFFQTELLVKQLSQGAALMHHISLKLNPRLFLGKFGEQWTTIVW